MVRRNAVTNADLAPIVLDGPAIARALGVHPGSIRRWASAGEITRRGTDARGRALYDLDEVQARATRGRRAGLVAGAAP